MVIVRERYLRGIVYTGHSACLRSVLTTDFISRRVVNQQLTRRKITQVGLVQMHDDIHNMTQYTHASQFAQVVT